jgi:hypothetical protein
MISGFRDIAADSRSVVPRRVRALLTRRAGNPEFSVARLVLCFNRDLFSTSLSAMLHAVRRLLAVWTLLSTLFGALGWSHGVCSTGADGVMTEMEGREAMQVASSPEGSDLGQGESDRRAGCDDMASEGDGAPRAPAGMCSMVAHCGSAFLAPGALPASPLAWAALPPEGRTFRPTDPAHEPELQPPKA